MAPTPAPMAGSRYEPAAPAASMSPEYTVPVARSTRNRALFGTDPAGAPLNKAFTALWAGRLPALNASRFTMGLPSPRPGIVLLIHGSVPQKKAVAGVDGFAM